MIKYPMPKKMNCPITKEQPKKKPKYNNKKVCIDGIWFVSQKEGDRYKELKLMVRAKEIKDLRLQVVFELQPSFIINKKTIRAIKYVADFTYYENDKLVVEDTKGMRTEVYKLKAKMFAYKYGMEIKEI